jgi:7-cyano-7-deazaguanine tRNA-ribosyltransferase
VYPLNAEVPERLDRRSYERAADGVARLAAANPDVTFTLGHTGWPASALERLPEAVDTYELGVDDAFDDGEDEESDERA